MILTIDIGNTAITGDKLTAMPQIEEVSDKTAFPFGQAHTGYTLSANLGFDHEAATGGALRLTAYDAEGNTLFTACYNGWLVVTFGNEMTNYVFDASDCELYTLYTFFPVE